MERSFVVRDYSLILRPILSEKALSKDGVHVFQVSLDANKSEIKKAVEKLFQVKVRDVNTLISRSDRRTSRRELTKQRKLWKKAVVSLENGHQIQLPNLK